MIDTNPVLMGWPGTKLFKVNGSQLNYSPCFSNIAILSIFKIFFDNIVLSIAIAAIVILLLNMHSNMKKIILPLLMVLVCCTPGFSVGKATQKEESKKANDFFERVFNELVDRSPMYQTYLGIKKDYSKLDDISDENEIREINILKENLAKLKKEINFNALDEQTKLSYRLYVYNANLRLEGFKYRFHNYPVNQMFGYHSELPSFLINIHKITDTSDAEAYISRLRASYHFLDQLTANLKEREQKGIIAPKFVFPLVIEDCKNLLKGAPFDSDTAKSTLLEDFTVKLDKLPALNRLTRTRLLDQATKALVDSLRPAYEKLILYLIVLEKKADTRDGVWKFPDGENFYAYALKNSTTTALSPEQIFQTGLKEVARIHGEMKKIMHQVNFSSDSLKHFFVFMKTDKQFYFPNDEAGKQGYLKRSVEIIDSMRSQLDKLFITKPKAGLIVKAVEPFREKSTATAFYQDPAPDGSRPGIYYVNLYDMSTAAKYEMEALAYHEAIPGHHMQLSIAQELQDMPKFRKYGFYTSYVEGWGLYAELVPKEIGFYKNVYSDYGRLSMELRRACRLVVDVGLHQKRWTREQAIQYLRDNTSDSDLESRKSIERYIVMPSQATAYKVGMLKIVELREKARKALSAKFDLREYHEIVLKFGAVPLDVLEENVNNWIKAKLKG